MHALHFPGPLRSPHLTEAHAFSSAASHADGGPGGGGDGGDGGNGAGCGFEPCQTAGLSVGDIGWHHLLPLRARGPVH